MTTPGPRLSSRQTQEHRTPVWVQVSGFPPLGSQTSKWLCHYWAEAPRPKETNQPAQPSQDSVRPKAVSQAYEISCCILKPDQPPPVSHRAVLSALWRAGPGSPGLAAHFPGAGGSLKERSLWFFGEEDGTVSECLAVLFITKLRGHGKRE